LNSLRQSRQDWSSQILESYKKLSNPNAFQDIVGKIEKLKQDLQEKGDNAYKLKNELKA